MKSICYILIFILITLFLWNINNKENFTCNIGMAKYAQCFERHQGRNEKGLTRINTKISGLQATLDEFSKKIKNITKKQGETTKKLDNLKKIEKDGAKSDVKVQDPNTER